jgi:hypothetical protein
MAPPRVKSQVSGPPKGFKDKPKGGKGKSLSKRAVSEISEAARFAEKIGSDKKFSDLAKQYKQYDVKYPDRPPTFRGSYGEEVNKVGTPLASTYYKDPVTGEERFFTAQAPTFKQLAGDIGRGLFSGYNTLSYDPNAGGIPTTTGGQIVRQQGLFPLLADKAMSGQMGIIGLAKGLYEKFTNSATKAKDALVKGVEKLSDIDLEILKNKGQYKFTSKKPEIQEVEDLQKTQMTEFDKANIIRQGIEQLETTPITGTTTLPQQPPGFKVMPTSYFPGQFGATPVPNNIQQAQNPNELRRALMENTMPNNFPQEKPYLMQQDDYYYQDKERFSPQGNQYLYAAEGGSVDNKLNDIQKKTNNIYGTGILSVR